MGMRCGGQKVDIVNFWHVNGKSVVISLAMHLCH